MNLARAVPDHTSDTVPPPSRPGLGKTTTEGPSEKREPREAQGPNKSTMPSPSAATLPPPPSPHRPPAPLNLSGPSAPSFPPSSYLSTPSAFRKPFHSGPGPSLPPLSPSGDGPVPTSALARRRRRQHRGRCPSAPRAPLLPNRRRRSRRPSPSPRPRFLHEALRHWPLGPT